MYPESFEDALKELKAAVGDYVKLDKLRSRFMLLGAIPGEYTGGFSFSTKAEEIPEEKRASYLYEYARELIECTF